MTIPDGPTLLGIAAIITSITGLITALRGMMNRTTISGPDLLAQQPERSSRSATDMAGVGEHGSSREGRTERNGSNRNFTG